MKMLDLTIEGMSCGHCVMAVKKELAKIPGVTVESVEIGKARVQIDEATVSRDTLAGAIADAGYRIA